MSDLLERTLTLKHIKNNLYQRELANYLLEALRTPQGVTSPTQMKLLDLTILQARKEKLVEIKYTTKE